MVLKHLHRNFLCETSVIIFTGTSAGPPVLDFPQHRCWRLLGGLCWAQAADLCGVSGHVLLGGRPGMGRLGLGRHFLENSLVFEAEGNEKGRAVFLFLIWD